MQEHVNYSQEKSGLKNKDLKSCCNLKLKSDQNRIIFTGTFSFDSIFKQQVKIGDPIISEKITTQYFHELNVDKTNGDFQITYKIETTNSGTSIDKTTYFIKKNNFSYLELLCNRGIIEGESKKGFWGLKYYRATINVFNIIKSELFDQIKSPYILDKTYDEYHDSQIFDLIVDFHLDKKSIKGHNNVYEHIKNEYPKKKWLKLNENKFLPAILDEYGIKTKYFIGELCKPENEILNIKVLAYLCKLFGDEYIDYIKEINWNKICKIRFIPSKFHQCKTESEKRHVVKTILNWNKNRVRNDSPIESLFNLFSLRSFLEKNGYDLKIKVKSAEDIENIMAEWILIKKYLSRGYREKYDFPQSIIDDIQQPIICDDKVFVPKLLISEDDFILEGHKMKNCMARHFAHAAIYWYISLSHKNKTINLQFRKESFNQGFAKANTAIDQNLFGKPIGVLSSRLEKYQNFIWGKIRYDIIKKS